MDCPFFSNPPPTKVQWKMGATPLISGDQFQTFMNNGTLHVRRLAITGAVNFSCNISNEYGADRRIFNLLVLGE